MRTYQQLVPNSGFSNFRGSFFNDPRKRVAHRHPPAIGRQLSGFHLRKKRVDSRARMASRHATLLSAAHPGLWALELRREGCWGLKEELWQQRGTRAEFIASSFCWIRKNNPPRFCKTKRRIDFTWWLDSGIQYLIHHDECKGPKSAKGDLPGDMTRTKGWQWRIFRLQTPTLNWEYNIHEVKMMANKKD